MRTTGAQEAPLCPPVLGICSLSLRQGLLEMLWGGGNVKLTHLKQWWDQPRVGGALLLSESLAGAGEP